MPSDLITRSVYFRALKRVFRSRMPALAEAVHLDGLAWRLQKAQNGNLGDIKPVAQGVCEMREHFGPGWRMYYVQRGEVLIVMLGGGDKSSQAADIAKAVELSTTLEE